VIAAWTYLALGVLLWVIVAFRWRSLISSGSDRPMSIALLFMGGFGFLGKFTLQEGTGTLTHGALTVAVLKNACIWGMAVSVLWLITVLRNPDREWSSSSWIRVVAVTVGAAVMLSPFVTAAPTILPERFSSDVYAPNWGGLLYWVVNTLTPGVACVAAAHLTITNSREARRPQKTGLTLIAIGTTLGVALLALKATQLLVFVSGGQLIGFYPPALTIGPAVVVSFIAAGSCYQPLYPWANRLLSTSKDRRNYAQLQQLWEQLSDPASEVASFAQGSDGDGAFRSARLMLLRRVIEIRDGALGLRPYLSSDVLSEADRLLATLPPSATEHPAAVEAAQLAAANQARSRGDLPGNPPTQLPEHHRGGADLADEVRWLLEVANWFRQLPTTVNLPGGA